MRQNMTGRTDSPIALSFLKPNTACPPFWRRKDKRGTISTFYPALNFPLYVIYFPFVTERVAEVQSLGCWQCWVAVVRGYINICPRLTERWMVGSKNVFIGNVSYSPVCSHLKSTHAHHHSVPFPPYTSSSSLTPRYFQQHLHHNLLSFTYLSFFLSVMLSATNKEP